MKIKISVKKLQAALLVLNNPDARKVTSGLWVLGDDIFASNGYCYYSDLVDKNKKGAFIYIPYKDVSRIAQSGLLDKNGNITLQQTKDGVWFFERENFYDGFSKIEIMKDEEIAKIQEAVINATSNCIENSPPNGVNGEYLNLGVDVLSVANDCPFIHIAQNGKNRAVVMQQSRKQGTAKFYIMPVR